MKTTIIACLLAITTAAYAQEFKYPGSKCTDLAILQEQLALAPNNDYKVLLSAQIAYVQSPPATFDDACTMISGIAEQIIPGASDDAKAYYCKQFAYIKHLWLDDLAAFCLANPSAYDLNIALRGKEQGKPWALSVLVACVSNYDLRAAGVPKALTALVDYHLSGDLASDEFKVILEKMDIRYTNQLIKNKEEWAPVVAGIRTLRERFQN